MFYKLYFVYTTIFVHLYRDRELHEDEPFIDIIDYFEESGRVEMQMSTLTDCEDDACFDGSNLVISEKNINDLGHRERAIERCAESNEYFVKYNCN